MKPVRSIGFILAIVFTSLSACMQSPDCFRENVVCVGLVTNRSGIEDHGLNQGAWEGLQQARDGRFADHIAYIESVDARDYLKNIEAFAQNGYDIIITIGPAMDDETLQAADLYPDSVFIGIDQPQNETRPNLLSILFREDQMGFWAGVLAVRLTKTGIIGAVCETASFDSMWRYCEGFRAGAAYITKDVQVVTLYREEQSSERLFVDSEWGYAAGQNLIDRGADVIFAAGGGTGQGALLAAAEAGVRAIGAERDQARALPEAAEALVTSVYGGASPEVQRWTRYFAEGNTANGAAAGVFEYASYSEFESQVSESLKIEMDGLLAALNEGELEENLPIQRP